MDNPVSRPQKVSKTQGEDVQRARKANAAQTATRVNREAVRILVADIGYNEASKRLNIKAGTLRQWAKRFHWHKPIVHSQTVTTVTTSPAQAHQELMHERKLKTEAQLTEYNLNATKDLTELKDSKERLKHTRKAKDLADVHRTIFPAESDKARPLLNLAVLIGDKRPVKAQVIESTSCQHDAPLLGDATD